MFDECVFVLNDPVSARVKEAAFRILAELPGTRVIGRTTDPLGHPAYELLHSEHGGTVIFIDPRRGRLTGLHWHEPPTAGQRQPFMADIPPLYGRSYDGPLNIMTYWVSSGFTNTSPPVPHSH